MLKQVVHKLSLRLQKVKDTVYGSVCDMYKEVNHIVSEGRVLVLL